MTKRIGVWIDHRLARVVSLDEEGESQSLRHVESDAEEVPKANAAHLPPGSVGQGGNRSKERRRRQQLSNYYDTLLRLVRPADELVIVGPGAARDEFARHLKSQKGNNLPSIRKVDGVDAKLTEPQIVAHIRALFGVTHEPSGI